MSCQRCGGFLVTEFCDATAQAGRMDINGIRCCNCGNVEDSVIRANRLHPPQRRRGVRRNAARYGGVITIRRSSRPSLGTGLRGFQLQGGFYDWLWQKSVGGQ